jgi:hypothetical protein
MLARLLLLLPLLALWNAEGVLAANLKLDFPQIALGDVFNTTIDLANKGTETFVGDLEIRGDLGGFLSVSINGVPVSGQYALSIPAGAAQRFAVTRAGGLVAGHALVWDRSNYQDQSFNQQVNGSLVYQWKDGTTLLDSIGVVPSPYMEHCYFVAESTSTVFTGLALSEFSGSSFNVTLKAKNSSGAQIGTSKTVSMTPFSHTAVFIHELFTLPADFRGTVEIESPTAVAAVVLRMEGIQFSTSAVAPYRVAYDITMSNWLPAGVDYTAEGTISVTGGLIDGLLRLISPAPDAAAKTVPLLGRLEGGTMVASGLTQVGGQATLISLSATPPVHTYSPQITGQAILLIQSGATANVRLGTFLAQRRQ